MPAAGLTAWAVPAYHAGVSMIAFAMYALDKSAAVHGQRRIRESRLHLLAVLGGWPGAFAAQRLLRHKTRKPAFQRTYWATVAGHCAALTAIAYVAGLPGLPPP